MAPVHILSSVDLLGQQAAAGPVTTLRPGLEPGTVTTADPVAAGADGWQRALRRDPGAVAEALSLLHRSVPDRDALTGVLQAAVAFVVRRVAGVDHASVTAQLVDGAAPCTVASSGQLARDLDEQQYTLGDGPILQALRTHQPVVYDQQQLVAQWPSLAAAVTGGGLHSVWSTSLCPAGGPGVSLNLYSTSVGALDPPGPQDALLPVVTELLARAVAEHHAVHQLTVQVAQLQASHRTRAPIEQAKGILMAVHHMSEDEAFDRLRSRSQTTNTKLRDVAAGFVATHSHQPPTTATTSTGTEATGTGAADGVGGSVAVDYRAAFDHAPLGMAITDRQGRLLTVNTALAHLLHARPTDLVGRRLPDLTDPADGPGPTSAGSASSTPAGATISLDRPDGSTATLAVFTAPTPPGSGVGGLLVLQVHDVTAHHELTTGLRHRLLHDPLTGAANQTLLTDRITHALQTRDLPRHPVSLLYLDLDHFKTINDTCGHDTGDAVLREVAHRLRRVSREHDTVARLGGDEFVLLCQDTTAEQAATHARLHDALAPPVAVGAHRIAVRATIGCATTTASATTARELLHTADTAMYEAKPRSTHLRVVPPTTPHHPHERHRVPLSIVPVPVPVPVHPQLPSTVPGHHRG